MASLMDNWQGIAGIALLVSTFVGGLIIHRHPAKALLFLAMFSAVYAIMWFILGTTFYVILSMFGMPRLTSESWSFTIASLVCAGVLLVQVKAMSGDTPRLRS